jgi:uncharacterized protein YgiM (DUF1202 family)
MKKVVFVICLILFVAGFAAAQSVGSTLFVAVKTLTLKSGTGYFDSNKGTLKYGEKVTVIKVNGKYVEVKSEKNPSLTGWTVTTGLARRIAAANSNSISTKELALAGKGFSQETERTLKSQGTNLNYAEVDRTEAIIVRDREVKRFIEEGQLNKGK